MLALQWDKPMAYQTYYRYPSAALSRAQVDEYLASIQTLEQSAHLNDFDVNFLAGCTKSLTTSRHLSEKQRALLDGMPDRLKIQAQAESAFEALAGVQAHLPEAVGAQLAGIRSVRESGYSVSEKQLAWVCQVLAVATYVVQLTGEVAAVADADLHVARVIGQCLANPRLLTVGDRRRLLAAKQTVLERGAFRLFASEVAEIIKARQRYQEKFAQLNEARRDLAAANEAAWSALAAASAGDAPTGAAVHQLAQAVVRPLGRKASSVLKVKPTPPVTQEAERAALGRLQAQRESLLSMDQRLLDECQKRLASGGKLTQVQVRTLHHLDSRLPKS